MAFVAYDRLNNLEKSKTDWKIKVRVTRMWPTVTPDGTVKGYNLILLDDDNAHIHAFSYADSWNSIGNGVTEGRVYVIGNFAVRDAVGNLKPVSAKYTLRLTNGTTFESIDDDFMIPEHKFEFIDIGELINIASQYESNENPEFATDVIGAVEEFEKIKKISTKIGERDIVRFKLCDTSVRHRVAVWGDLAKKVDDAYHADLEKPVIAILTTTKLTTYNNAVQISTLPSSKVYFNIQDDYVSEMRQRLEEEGYKSAQYDVDQNYELSVVKSYDKLSLKELNEYAAQNVKANIFSIFRIAKIEEHCFWWYNSCNKCQAQVTREGKTYKCSECPRLIPVAEKRFRVKVYAEDATFSCPVFLMDRVVKPIISISASNLKKKTDNDPKMIPDVINSLVGKEVTVIIDVKEISSSEGPFIFEASDMYQMPIPATSISGISSPPDIPVITLTDSLDMNQSGRTPGSALSVNKKIKKEK